MHGSSGVQTTLPPDFLTSRSVSRLVTGVSHCRNASVLIWDIHGGVRRRLTNRLGQVVLALEVSPCGTRVATAGGWSIFLWAVEPAQLEREHVVAWSWDSRVALSWGGAWVAGAKSQEVFLWGPLDRRARFVYVGHGLIHFKFLSGDLRGVTDDPEQGIHMGSSQDHQVGFAGGIGSR